MKTKIILYTVILSCVSLAGRCQQKAGGSAPDDDMIITKIEFTTLTRGYQKQVFFSADSLIKIIDGRQNEHKVVKRKMDSEKWQELVKAASAVSLVEIPQLQSPTFRRSFDGARHSSIVITTRDGKTYTHGFDDEHPHKKLQPLMDLIKKAEGND